MSEKDPWDDLTPLEKQQSCYSDYHKGVWGFRPRGASTEEWNSITWLTEQIRGLDEYMESRKATFASREEMREDGWCVPEVESHCQAYAEHLRVQREARLKELYGEYY